MGLPDWDILSAVDIGDCPAGRICGILTSEKGPALDAGVKRGKKLV